MSQAYYRALIDERPRVLAEIIRHNLRARTEPSSVVSSEAKANLSPALRAALSRHPRLARSAFGAGPAPAPWRDFASPRERLALMPPEDLRRLALMTSAAVHGERLSKVVMRDDVLRIREVLGADLYRWALVRGRFLAGSLAADLGALTATLPLEEALPRLAGMVSQAMALAQAKEGTPGPSEGFEPGPAPLSPEMVRRLAPFYKKLILREFDAKWTRFFD